VFLIKISDQNKTLARSPGSCLVLLGEQGAGSEEQEEAIGTSSFSENTPIPK
jgi:hypothetical protein